MKLHKVLDGSQGGSASILNVTIAWTLDPKDKVEITAGTLAYAFAVTWAMESQKAIGWEHAIFDGFVSVRLGHIYTTAVDSSPPEGRRTHVISLVSKLIKTLQDYTPFILHRTGTEGLAAVHASLNNDITQMYAMQETLSTNSM